MPTPAEEIKARLDIVDFINEYVKLTPGGANWKARCPFHHEKSASFMVSRAKGIWHCFGCSKGGDVFAFLMEMEGLEFGEALRTLAKRAGVKLQPRDPQLATQRTKALDIMRAAVEYAHKFLVSDPLAKTAREYLQRRGVSEDTVDLFKLGYMPPAWETMQTHLKEIGFREEDVFLAGLTVKRQQGSGSYDRFRGRILFPIFDIHGNALGFGGRILEGVGGASGEHGGEGGQEAGAKYINTPQTVIYDKSSVLYGIDRGRQEIRRQGFAIVVEGYMDCLASHQAGVTNVVASSGTALTEQQVRLLKRYATTVVLAFDADAAGQEAAKRGVAQALVQELTVKVLEIPSGKDPDELIRQDVDGWRGAIAKARPVLEYFFDMTFRKVDLTKVEDKKTAARELLPMLANTRDVVEQTHYLKQLAEKLGVEERLLRERLPRSVQQLPATSVQPAAGSQQPVADGPLLDRDRNILLSERLVALLLKYPEEVAFVAEQLSPQALSGEAPQRLYTEVLVWYTEHQHFDPEAFRRDRASDAYVQQSLDVYTLLADKDFPEENGLSIRRELASVIQPLKRHHVQERLNAVTKRIESFERSHRDRELGDALREFRELTDEMHQLDT